MIDECKEEDPKIPNIKCVCASLLKYKPWLCNSRVKNCERKCEDYVIMM